MSRSATATLFWGVVLDAACAARELDLNDFDQAILDQEALGYELVLGGTDNEPTYGLAIEESVQCRTENNCERPIEAPEFDLAWPHRLTKGLDGFDSMTGVSKPGWYLFPMSA
jgi:hypothetical protein